MTFDEYSSRQSEISSETGEFSFIVMDFLLLILENISVILITFAFTIENVFEKELRVPYCIVTDA